jgi:hypothetical protein
VLSAEDSEDIGDDFNTRSRSLSANTFADPYFWAGLVFPADSLQTMRAATTTQSY